MTQPRKEQINDQRTYYTPVTQIGITTPVSFGTPDAPGGTTQTIQNNITENYYTEFLASTVTGAPGGAEADTPGYFYGNFGPFVSPIVPGAGFTITLPNINSGNPVSIVFQPTDVVNIGGSPVITTSRAAARINQALTVAGVSPTSPVAANINGQLVLFSAGPSGYTTGQNAFITVNDINVGVCSALGFASTNTATATGISSPKRGIVTTVQFNPGNKVEFGGYVPLQLPDGTPCITKSNVQINVSGFGNLPVYPPGQTVYGRLQQFTDISANSKFVITYYRNGAVPGQIITSQSNFASLLNTDTFSVTVSTTNPLYFSGGDLVIPPVPEIQNYTFTVSFGSAPTGPQDVINAVNLAWNGVAATIGLPFGPAGVGGIVGLVPGPWYFTQFQDSFWIQLNGQTPILIAPTTGTYAAADLVAFINAAISTAGQAAQGSAQVISPSILAINSALTTGPSSTVQIYAGDPLGTAALPTNSDMRMLDKIGISPGVYSGSVIAKLYGNDEIKFVCPDHTVSDPHGTPSGISITASPTVAAKLGLPSSTVTQNVRNSFEPVSPPTCNAEIPEMMYFGEVPENIETQQKVFSATDEVNPVSAGTGTGNLGVSPLLGLDGKVNPDLIHKIFDALQVRSLSLGNKNLASPEGAFTPRIQTPFAPASAGVGMTLIWEGVSTAGISGPGASQVMRMLVDGSGGLWFTTNAQQSATPTTPQQWNKDSPSQSSSALYVGQSATAGIPKIELLYAAASVASPFVFVGEPGASNGVPPIAFNPAGAAGTAVAYQQIGQQIVTGNDNLIPRVQYGIAGGNVTLIWECPPQIVSAVNVGGVRCYVTQQQQFPAGAGLIMWVTFNAFWNGTAWQKDINGLEATAQLMVQGSPSDLLIGQWITYYQAPTDDTPWALWGTSSIDSYTVTQTDAEINQFEAGTLVPGANIPQSHLGRVIPRILTAVDNGATFHRTLMEQWGIPFLAGGGGVQTRTYRGWSFTPAAIGTPPGNTDVFMQTTNAVWDSFNGVWIQDDVTQGSSMQVWAQVGGSSPVTSSAQISFYYVPAGSGTFHDNIWAQIGNFSRVGLQVPFTSDPTNALGIPNLVNNASTIKAWVSFNIQNTGSGSASTTVHDSWNIASVGTLNFFGALIPEILYHALLGSSNYACILTGGLDNASPTIGPVIPISGIQGNTGVALFVYTQIGPSPSAIDFGSTSVPNACRIDMMICGRQ